MRNCRFFRRQLVRGLVGGLRHLLEEWLEISELGEMRKFLF